MKPVGWVLTFVSVTMAIIFFRSATVTSAIDLLKGAVGLNGIALPQDLFEPLGPLTNPLHHIGVMPDPSWSTGFYKTAIWISGLMFVALACPNTLQILARYEPALGVKSRPTKLMIGRIIEWNTSLPWAIAMSAVAAIAIGFIGGPSEFLYWQF
jgi:hypothetical protein